MLGYLFLLLTILFQGIAGVIHRGVLRREKDFILYGFFFNLYSSLYFVPSIVGRHRNDRSRGKWFEEMLKKRTTIVFSIVTIDEDKLIGNCALTNIDKANRRANADILIGYKNYWGKGYGRDAFVLLLDYGFVVLNLKTIYLRVKSFNKRAIKMYEKVGFQKQGRLRNASFMNGKWFDDLIMDITREEFFLKRQICNSKQTRKGIKIGLYFLQLIFKILYSFD